MVRKPFVIRNDLELAVAINRAEELAGCTNGSDEERELAEIAAAVEVYTDSMRVLRMVDADPNRSVRIKRRMSGNDPSETFAA